MVSSMRICEKCGTAFQCIAENISACHCSAVALSENERKFIALKYKDCLCGPCLQEVKIDYQNMSEFYIENGRYVFTEKFLLQRGFCCKNGCRHCPYGFIKVID